MSPKTAEGLVIYSHKMPVQGSPDIESLIRDHLARVVAAELDKKALNGDGTGNAPVGLLNLGVGAETYANGGLRASPTW